MSHQEWPADAYAIGSYIQATVADRYLDYLTIKPTDKVLDIGCGDGSFSKKIIAKAPQGSVLGIDASKNMLKLAEKTTGSHPNFSTQHADVLSMNYTDQFDYIVSFWCLQWSQNIHKAFANIAHALKKGGRLLTLFPAGDDPYIKSYYAIKESQQFPSLKHFKAPVDYSTFNNLAEQLASIPFNTFKIELIEQSIILPSLDTFRHFVNGIAFYQGQIPDPELKEINDAMVRHYQNECNIKYNDTYQFNFSIYFITGEK
jgi:ubiquinone/menaquinone biosynthesis C-methylase UbiE